MMRISDRSSEDTLADAPAVAWTRGPAAASSIAVEDEYEESATSRGS